MITLAGCHCLAREKGNHGSPSSFFNSRFMPVALAGCYRLARGKGKTVIGMVLTFSSQSCFFVFHLFFRNLNLIPMSEDIKPDDTLKDRKEEPQKVEVVIVRHKQFFEMLKEPQTMWRVLLSLFLIIVVVVVGLSLVIISVKRFYPYNTIETNIYGATIMQDEDKEVIYWLFNTAELWANSGIEVEKGNELTIRASGASFTAMHHLVEAAMENTEIDDKWVNTEGQPRSSERDRLRAAFRIVKHSDEGKLLMKVVNTDYSNEKPDWLKDVKPEVLDENGDVEIIGKERVGLKVKKDGKLHFAVNDIVLTDTVIKSMYGDFVMSVGMFCEDSLGVSGDGKTKMWKILKEVKDSIKNCNGCAIMSFLTQKNGELLEAISMQDASGRLHGLKGYKLGLGFYPGKEDLYPLVNELVYYKEKEFRDAWFVDNIGSFLIVIERKR